MHIFFKQNQHKLPDSNSMVIYKCWPRCKPWQIPPGSYICMTHRAASVLHASEPTQNTFFNSAARSMQNVLTVAICQGKPVNEVRRDATSVNGNTAQSILAMTLHVAGNTFWRIVEHLFATIMRKKLPGSQQQHSHSGSTIEIFSRGELLRFHNNTPHPLASPAQLEAAALRRNGRREAADCDWPVSLWLKTAMDCPPTPCMVNGWSFGTCGDASFSPAAPRAASSSLRLNRTWGTQSKVKDGSRTGRRQWRHHVRLGYILNTAVVHPSRMVEMVNRDGKPPVTEAACPTLCARPTSKVLGQCPIFFCWTQRFNFHKDQRICFRWEVFMQVFDHRGAAAHK